MKRPGKALLVDDEPAIVKILAIKLRASGYEVVTAPNGETALALFEAARPDILLLDILMPGIDGFQVLARVRACSDVPVIVISAVKENARKALACGADACLVKPFDVDELMKCVTRMMSRRR